MNPGTNPEAVIGVRGTAPEPHSTDDPRRSQPDAVLAYMDLMAGQSIIGRSEDLRAAAAVIGERHIVPDVRAGRSRSGRVKAQAEAEGLDRTFPAAGFE